MQRPVLSLIGLFAGAVLVLAALATVVASDPGEKRHDPALITLLSHFHDAPAREALARFEPGLGERLAAIVEDEQVPRLARLRAMTALAEIEGLAVFDRIADVALGSSEIRMRLAAVHVIGHRLSDDPRAVEILSDILRDGDAGLRTAAVRSLAAIATPEADQRLRLHRMAERNMQVRQALRRAKTDGARLPEGRLDRATIRPRLEDPDRSDAPNVERPRERRGEEEGR